MGRLLFIVLFFVSCTAPNSAVSTQPGDAAAIAGGKLFRIHCAACHGADASGTRYAPNLKSSPVLANKAEALFQYITNGDLRRGMPAWSRLPDERRWQLVAYLQSLP